MTVAGQCRALTGLRWAERHPGVHRDIENLNPATLDRQGSTDNQMTAPVRLCPVHPETQTKLTVGSSTVTMSVPPSKLSTIPAAIQAWTQRFSLLGDPTRLRLLIAINAAGPMSVSDLAVATCMTDDHVSQTLRFL